MHPNTDTGYRSHLISLTQGEAPNVVLPSSLLRHQSYGTNTGESTGREKQRGPDDGSAPLAWRAWGAGYRRPVNPPPAGPCRHSPPRRCGSCRGWSWSCRFSACGGQHCRGRRPRGPRPGPWCRPRCPRCGSCCGWRSSDGTGACASCCRRCSHWPATASPAGPCRGPGCR